MKPIMKIFILTMLLAVAGCDSTKKQAAEEAKMQAQAQAETKTMNKELISRGYHVGTIKSIKTEKCSFIIVDEKTGVEFDPINFEEANFDAMRVNNQKVYYKYTPLRMMNRCGNYQPVSITDCKLY